MQSPNVVALMRECGIEVSWSNYLKVMFLGQVPDEIDPEVEEELSDEFFQRNV